MFKSCPEYVRYWKPSSAQVVWNATNPVCFSMMCWSWGSHGGFAAQGAQVAVGSAINLGATSSQQRKAAATKCNDVPTKCQWGTNAEVPCTWSVMVSRLQNYYVIDFMYWLLYSCHSSSCFRIIFVSIARLELHLQLYLGRSAFAFYILFCEHIPWAKCNST